MRQPPGTVRDAGGKEHRIRYLGTVGGLREEVGPKKFWAVCDRVDRRWRDSARLLRWLAVALSALWLGLLLMQSRTGWGAPWWVLITNAVTVVAVGFQFFHLRRSLPTAARRVERLRDAMLAEGLCPACAYSVDSLEPVDGVIVCPECGAAWFPTL